MRAVIVAFGFVAVTVALIGRISTLNVPPVLYSGWMIA
jgi:hypothetical protein